MRIAQISPLYESVPPKCYGGTERVVSHLTEELIHQGHDVTLFASGDSVTTARLVPPCERALRLDENCIDKLAHHILMLEMACKSPTEFDVIHCHLDYVHFPVFRRLEVPNLTTLHGRLDIPDLVGLCKEFSDIPLVSISDAQRAPLWWANWQATVYHGLPEELYPFCQKPGTYLAFLGRISPEKRVDTAIEIAKRLEMPIKIAAKVDKVDEEYFQAIIKPLLSSSLVEYIGEIGELEKSDFLGNAYALLFPIDWPEPFGLVMIEAMACGTPIIAYRRGSVPEVMEDGITGFVVEDVDEAVQAVERLASIDRRRVREVFENRFTARRMAEDYLKVYQQLVEDTEVSRGLDRVTLPMLVGNQGTFSSNPAIPVMGEAGRPDKGLDMASSIAVKDLDTGGSPKPAVRKRMIRPRS